MEQRSPTVYSRLRHPVDDFARCVACTPNASPPPIYFFRTHKNKSQVADGSAKAAQWPNLRLLCGAPGSEDAVDAGNADVELRRDSLAGLALSGEPVDLGGLGPRSRLPAFVSALTLCPGDPFALALEQQKQAGAQKTLAQQAQMDETKLAANMGMTQFKSEGDAEASKRSHDMRMEEMKTPDAGPEAPKERK